MKFLEQAALDLAGEVTASKLDNSDCYPRIRLWQRALDELGLDRAKIEADVREIHAGFPARAIVEVAINELQLMAAACIHPREAIGKVHENDTPHCLWCGDISDLGMLVRHLSTIYMHITNGRVSKPNTLPEAVIAIADDCETKRTEEAVAEALEPHGPLIRMQERLELDLPELVPTVGEPEPGGEVTIFWKPVEGEVGGPFKDEGYIFIWPHEDIDVGACVHIPEPDPRGDRDAIPEWLTLNELLANPLIERIEFGSLTNGW